MGGNVTREIETQQHKNYQTYSPVLNNQKIGPENDTVAF